MDEIEKKLNLMKYWLFGTFAIVSAAITAFVYLMIDNINNIKPDAATTQWYGLPLYWVFLGGFAVLLIIFFLIYKAVIEKDQSD